MGVGRKMGRKGEGEGVGEGDLSLILILDLWRLKPQPRAEKMWR